jgi:hypothetical protein
MWLKHGDELRHRVRDYLKYPAKQGMNHQPPKGLLAKSSLHMSIGAPLQAATDGLERDIRTNKGRRSFARFIES